MAQYAIQPTIRGNNKFKRDDVIKTVANVVGPEHPVNLKNYDLIILVDVVQVSSQCWSRRWNMGWLLTQWNIECHWNECCGQ